ncbi:MAG: hypothetical protein RL263_159 [Bacteroidota bacterium]
MIFLIKRISLCILFFGGLIAFGQSTILPSSSTAEIVSGLREIKKRGLSVNVTDTSLISECKRVLDGRNDSTDQGVYRFIYFRDLIETKRRFADLPWYVSFLPLANTGVNPNFKGKDGKSGVWPLGYTIGKKYGLIQNSLYDERRDVEKSTEVAVKYFLDLNNIYKDWNLTVMAFNLGAARVNQVMHFRKALSFDSIFPYFLEEEKKQYRTFIATIYAFQVWEKQGVALSESKWIAYNQLKRIASSSFELPLGMLEEKTGISVDLIKKYNPALKADVIPYLGTKNSGVRPLMLRLPELEGVVFKQKQDSFALWVDQWNLKIAKERYGVQPVGVGAINRHTGEVLNRPQTVVKPPIEVAENTPVAMADSSISRDRDVAVSKVWVYYTIKRGDALYTLLDVFDCTEDDIRRWNNIRKSQFMIAGQKLRMEVDSNKKTYYSKINTMTLIEKRELSKND